MRKKCICDISSTYFDQKCFTFAVYFYSFFCSYVKDIVRWQCVVGMDRSQLSFIKHFIFYIALGLPTSQLPDLVDPLLSAVIQRGEKICKRAFTFTIFHFFYTYNGWVTNGS